MEIVTREERGYIASPRTVHVSYVISTMRRSVLEPTVKTRTAEASVRTIFVKVARVFSYLINDLRNSDIN